MAQTLGLTTEMVWVLSILGITVFLFVSEIVRVDVAALLVMVTLGVLSLVPGLETLASTRHLFNGFASNAVISIIAVMIIGAGLDRTGVMTQIAGFVLRVGGSSERRIVPIVSATVGVVSSFMQNVGAAALFLPVVSRISARTHVPMPRLLMPMGFCAILGGTITMVGSSPLILLNDLILNTNEALPSDLQMETFSLFAIAPVGLALVATGIAYFTLFGSFVLPSAAPEKETGGGSTPRYFKKVYGLDAEIHEVVVPLGNALVGKTIGEAERTHRIRIVATHFQGATRLAPDMEVKIDAPAVLAVMASPKTVESFAQIRGLELRGTLETFSETLVHTRAGISELVIPPNSEFIGKSVRDVRMRKTYGLSVLALHRGEKTTRRGLRDVPLRAGDALVCHNSWDALARLERNRNFVVVTSEYPHETARPHKVGHALTFFAIALALILFTDLTLSIALLIGALGMVISRVLTMDEAYEAVSWKTVFLLACLIPLGQAAENTGTAAWIATQTLQVLGTVPIWVLQLVVALLATFFSLIMSNVGATVLLVPLAINLGIGAGADPRLFAITVAVATSNSFVIPTHQVNALIMGPGEYRVRDFIRAGGIMTVLFLVVSLVMLNAIFG